MGDFHDVDGQELSLGDRVAYSKGGRHHNFATGVVVGFTPKMVKVEVKTGRSWDLGVTNLSSSNLAKLFKQGDY